MVITSDHGNLFGELGFYGHPRGVEIKPLVTVPRFEVDTEYYKDRDKIEFDEIQLEEKKESEEAVKQRLKRLGYI